MGRRNRSSKNKGNSTIAEKQEKLAMEQGKQKQEKREAGKAGTGKSRRTRRSKGFATREVNEDNIVFIS